MNAVRTVGATLLLLAQAIYITVGLKSDGTVIVIGRNDITTQNL